MALNFPNTPTNAQSYVDPNGHTWIYETATNSWTAQGVPLAGMVYRGSIDITTAPPTGATTGSVFTVSAGGTTDAGFTGLPTTVVVGAQVIYDGAKWQLMSSLATDATEAAKGIAEIATQAEVTTGTDDARIVTPLKLATAVPAASETVKGKVELATAAETTTGTDATRAVHPAGLKVELDKKVKKAGDTMTGDLKLPNLVATGDIQSTSQNGGQLAGLRNVLINGALAINQRVVTIAAAAVGKYGPDRWKKVDATNMTQVVEDLNFVPGAKYTLSWKGGAAQVLTAPASGHWTLPNIPITATEIQLEPGTVATPFERRSYGQELVLCQRYYERGGVVRAAPYVRPTGVNAGDPNCFATIQFRVTKRTTPNMSGASSFATDPVWQNVGWEVASAFITANTSSGEAQIGTWTASAEL